MDEQNIDINHNANVQVRSILILETNWKRIEIDWNHPETNAPFIKKNFFMKNNDFKVFSGLLADLHQQVFGEKIDHLPYGKSKTLSWLIFDKTGKMVSYKSLTNYVQAVLDQKPDDINPSDSTLAILTHCLLEKDMPNTANEIQTLIWYQYKSQNLMMAQS